MQNHCSPALGKVIREGPCRVVAFKLRQRGDKGLGRGRGGGNVFMQAEAAARTKNRREMCGCNCKGGSGARGNRKQGLGHGGPFRS